MQTLNNNVIYRIALLIQEENFLHKETAPVYHTGFPEVLCNTCPVRSQNASLYTTQLSQTHNGPEDYTEKHSWEGLEREGDPTGRDLC